MEVVLVGVSADGRGAGGVVLVAVSALDVVLVEVVLSKCIGGGVDGGCRDGGGAGWSKSIGGGAGTLVLCRAGDRAADGVSFLSIRRGVFLAVGTCGVFASAAGRGTGGVFGGGPFCDFASGGVCRGGTF